MKLSEINEKNKVKISEGNANIICNDGSCSIDSNIGIMGIEINYTGKAEITPQLPEGWFLQGSNSKIIIFTLQQIPIEKIINCKKIGLTSGASAPEKLVQDFISEIKKHIKVSTEEFVSTKENVTFKLPAILN